MREKTLRFLKFRANLMSIETLIEKITLIRALDGTHVHASIPIGDQDRYRNRKEGSQNVLAVVLSC